jgi:hypothetical protein
MYYTIHTWANMGNIDKLTNKAPLAISTRFESYQEAKDKMDELHKESNDNTLHIVVNY